MADQASNNVHSRLEHISDDKKKSPQQKPSKPDHRKRSSPQRTSSSNASTKPHLRCHIDNKNRCNGGNNCPNVHAKKTCQLHSKFGSCAFESQCEHRHPDTVCFEWQNHGSCRYGSECRHRHPQEMMAPSDNFLGRRQSPSAQWPKYSHRDQRGNRW